MLIENYILGTTTWEEPSQLVNNKIRCSWEYSWDIATFLLGIEFPRGIKIIAKKLTSSCSPEGDLQLFIFETG